MADELTPGDSWTISIGKDGVDVCEDFEEYFEEVADERGDNYSRAGRIKEAMAIYQALHETYADLEETPHPDEMGGPTFKFALRQAVLELDRREAAGEF